MRRFELTEDLLTGVEDIDSHHRTLLELANQAISLTSIKEEGPIFADALAFLSNYVIYHFAAEEHLMTMFGFPGYEHHRAWHDNFKGDVATYVECAVTEGLSKNLRLKVSFAIENWFLEHIRVTDRALAKFLQQRGGDALIKLANVSALKAAGKLPKDFDERSIPGASTQSY